MVFLMAFCDKLTQCYNITIRFSTNTYEQFEFHCGKIFYVIKAKVVAAMTNSIDKYYLDWGFEIAPSPKHLYPHFCLYMEVSYCFYPLLDPL